MNFPNLPGTKLRVDPTSVCPSAADDSAEIERRLGNLSEQDLPPVRPEWLEATVARASAARQNQPRLGPVRRLLAAAVALLGLQGVAAAATVTAIGAGVVVVASVLWTAERNSRETMSYSMALEVLRRGDQPEQHRVAALAKIVGRVRSVITVLRELRDGPATPSPLVEIAHAALASLQSGGLDAELSVAEQDPLAELPTVRSGDMSVELRSRAVRECAASALYGLRTIEQAPSGGTQFDESRRQLLGRIADQLVR